MKKLTGILLLVLSLSLGSGLLYLLRQQTPSLPGSELTDTLEQIGRLKVLDADWTLATQLTYSHPGSSFDRLASYLPEVRHLKDALSNGPLLADEAPPALSNKTRQLLLQLDNKEMLVERFKSDFAIVRNALNFYPLASRTLGEALDSSADKALKARIDGLRQRIESFLQRPDENLRSHLAQDIGRLDGELSGLPAGLSTPLGNFLSHARVLVERKSALDGTLEQLLNLSLNRTADDVQQLYLTHHQSQQQAELQADYQRTFIVAALGAGLALVGMLCGGLLWRRDHDFSQRLASELARRTEQQENERATASQSLVDRQLGDSLDGMKRMAATLAHEINTPLGYIDGNLQVLRAGLGELQLQLQALIRLHEQMEQCPGGAAMQQHVAQLHVLIQNLREAVMLDELPEIQADIQAGIQQIQHVVGELKDFTRQDRASQDWFSLAECIQSTLKMTRQAIPANTQVSTQIDTLPPLYGSPAEINQVLINLVINAAHAIEEAGREKGLIRIRAVRDGNQIQVSVMDNGPGIDESTRKRLFEPFFTTKEVGKGTGLGLAIARRIVTGHGGSLSLKTVQGKGSSFWFTLPMSGDAPALKAQ